MGDLRRLAETLANKRVDVRTLEGTSLSGRVAEHHDDYLLLHTTQISAGKESTNSYVVPLHAIAWMRVLD